MNKSNARSAKILTDAVEKTDQAQEDLQEAVDSLSSANAVLSGPMPTAQGAIADAVQQNLDAEIKVQDARQELENVKELIQEAQIVQASGDPSGNSGDGTASILDYFEGRRAQAREDKESRP